MRVQSLLDMPADELAKFLEEKKAESALPKIVKTGSVPQPAPQSAPQCCSRLALAASLLRQPCSAQCKT